MELYILSKQDLSILSICKLADYQINLDEETNAKSTFTLMKTNGLKKENYMVLNGLYRQFIFVIDDVQTEKESDVVTVTALDISNVFNRKVIEKNINTMKNKSIEEFLANTISENFVNSNDTALNVNYIEIYWHTNTQGNVATNAENGLYNFHTFLINCRQYKNIYTDFKLENLGNPQTVEGKRINVEAKNRKIVDIMLEGESQQATRSGKNLFNASQIPSSTNIVVSDNGKTITMPIATSGSGATPTTKKLSQLCPKLKVGDTATLRFNRNLGTTKNMYIYLNVVNLAWNINSPKAITQEMLDSYVSLFANRYDEGETGQCILTDFSIMLSSETDTSWEPYGASPSPDYRSEIENLEGKNKVKEINWKQMPSISTGATITNVNGYGTDYIDVDNTKQYIFSYLGTAGSKYVAYYDESKNFLGYSLNLQIDNYENWNVTKYVRLRVDCPQDSVTAFQLEEGTVATPYVPYNSLEFKDVGSNVLELSKGTVTLNGVTLTSDGETITINGTVSGNYPAVKLTNGLKAATSLETLVNNYISERVAQLEDIKDCTIQSIISGGSSTFTPYIGSYNKTVRELWYGIGTPAKTIQTSSTSLIAIYLGGKGSTYNNYKIKIGINKGTVAKAYEPYKQQTECFPLSEGQKLMEGSYLADDGIHHSRKQVVFDGSREYIRYTSLDSTNHNCFYTNQSDIYVDSTGTQTCLMSNYFKGDKFDNRALDIPNMWVNKFSSQIYFKVPKTITTVEELTTLFAEQYANGTPVIVEYELAEEEIVPYTETQQEAREKLRHFKGLNGENNITAQGTMTSTLDLTLYNVAEEDFDIYISKKGYFGALKYDINNLIDFMESNIPSIAEATESSVKIAGRDGDISLNTVYEPLSFEIVCYTEDNLTPEEKIIEEQKITSLLNSIKNQTKTFFMEREKKFYKVKYSGNLSVVRYPKHLKFTIPLKSSESYAMNYEESEIIGNGTKVSNTIKDTGAIFTIKGPATKPIISLNNYQMKYNENILEGNSLIINSEDSTITHITSAGVKTNAMRAYNHEFPKIKNGENQLAVSSGIDDEKQVNVKWYDLKI